LTWLIIFAIYIVVVGLQSYTIRLKKYVGKTNRGHGKMQTCKKHLLMLKQDDLVYEKHPEFKAFLNQLLKDILKGRRTWKTCAWQQKDSF